MTACAIFPSRIFEPRVVEDDFAAQYAAAERAGLRTYLLDQEITGRG